MSLGIVLLLASCGGGADETAPTTAAVQEAASSAEQVPALEAPQAVPTGDAASDTAAPSAEADPSPSFDGPPAPDFELALSDGSTFALSAEQKPVYVVFWAEW